LLLIARRNASGKPQWTLPKGGIEDGESDEQAALREVREETGHGAVISHRLGTIDYWFVWRPDQIRYHKFVHYFFMWWDGRPPGERDDEAEHVEWVPLDVALVRLAHRNERKLVEQTRDLVPSPAQPGGGLEAGADGGAGRPAPRAGRSRDCASSWWSPVPLRPPPRTRTRPPSSSRACG
jgi:8-oxo-dGTP pyrophosphatase MutT (NUDIX family)